MLTHHRILLHTSDTHRDSLLRMLLDGMGKSDLDIEVTSFFKLTDNRWMALLLVNLNPHMPPRLAEVVCHLDSLFAGDVDVFTANYQNRLTLSIQLSIVPTSNRATPVTTRGSHE